MIRFQNIEISVLMDLLSLHTARYTRMMMEGGNQQDFISCRDTIEDLQKEIRFRNAECDIIPRQVYAKNHGVKTGA